MYEVITVHKKETPAAVTMGKVSHVDKMRMQTLREQEFQAKEIIRAYPYFEHLINTESTTRCTWQSQT